MVYQANTDRSGATYRFRSRSSARFAVLEVSHSVAHAESDYKVENGGNDGYIDQHEQEGHRHVTECTPPSLGGREPAESRAVAPVTFGERIGSRRKGG
jgi:hypothetical protein